MYQATALSTSYGMRDTKPGRRAQHCGVTWLSALPGKEAGSKLSCGEGDHSSPLTSPFTKSCRLPGPFRSLLGVGGGGVSVSEPRLLGTGKAGGSLEPGLKQAQASDSKGTERCCRLRSPRTLAGFVFQKLLWLAQANSVLIHKGEGKKAKNNLGSKGANLQYVLKRTKANLSWSRGFPQTLP